LAAAVYTVGVLFQDGEVFLTDYGLAAHVALGVAAALFVLPAVAPDTGQRDRRSRPLALLRSRPLIWLGTISYGMYLWHVPFRDLVYKWVGAPRGVLPFAAMFVLTLAGGVALGAASWYLVERPAQAWMRARRPRQGAASPPRDERVAVGDGSTTVSASIPLS
jgi:peptidoglycan/LPS O-acetylase OafA/YrhL